MSTTENQLITQQRTGLINILNLTEKYGYVKQFEINNNYSGFAKGELHEERNLFAAPKDTTDIAIIDIENGKEINLLKPEETAIQQITSLKMVTLSNGDLYILGGYESGHLLLWDLKTSSVISELLYSFPITAIDYDLVSNRGLLTGAGANIICGFGIERASLQLSKKGGEAENIDLTPKDETKIKVDFVNCIKIRPDKKCLVVGDSNGIVNIHSWKSLRKLTALKVSSIKRILTIIKLTIYFSITLRSIKMKSPTLHFRMKAFVTSSHL